MADYNLDYLLAQVRRIEEHREKGTEAKIRKNYQEILKELRHYLADTYSQYAEDDKLTYEILQRHSRYARFLDEVEKKINDLSPETKRLIRSTVEQVYEQGDVVVNQSCNDLGTITISVQGTSPQKSYLIGLANAGTLFDIWVLNKSIDEKVGGSQAMVKKTPELGQAAELDDREFEIQVFDYTVN